MKVLLLGAGGMLGQDLVATTPQEVSLLPLTNAGLDISDTESMRACVEQFRPELIINAAAYTAVDKAETEPQLAFRINAFAVEQLGRVAAAARARLIHFSPDYAFDGTASQPYREVAEPAPLNQYGASKLAGERALKQTDAEFLIVRTQWLFGANGRSFPKAMFERARRGLKTTVVTDQVGRPTFTRDLAAAVWALVASRMTGVLHVANSGTATWFEVADRVFSVLGVRSLLAGCTTAEYTTAAQRPLRSVLDTRAHEVATGHALTHWEQALAQFIETMRRTVDQQHISR